MPTWSDDESITTVIVVAAGGAGGIGVIVSDAVPKTDPTVARIVAFPAAIAVTTPVLETPANPGVSELHVMLCPFITLLY